MKTNNIAKLIFIFLLVFSFAGCTKTNTNVDEINQSNETITDLQNTIEVLTNDKQDMQNRIDNLTQENRELKSSQNTDNQLSNTVLSKAFIVIEILKNKDMNSLSSYIHPSKGIRFSPYSYIDIQNDLVFTVSQIAGLLQDNENYTWGSYDGSGNPITMNFSDYYDAFIYDEDYVNPNEIGNNTLICKGNTTNNIEEIYQNGEFVEFHFNGFDPQYEGMDWKSLRLIFEEDNGDWYLVGIVHDQWTI